MLTGCLSALLLLLLATAAHGVDTRELAQPNSTVPCQGVPSVSLSAYLSAPGAMIYGFNGTYGFQVDMNNAGPDNATNVVMNVTIPSPLTIRSFNASYQATGGFVSCILNSGGIITCSLPFLYGATTARLSIYVSVPADGIPVNLTAKSYVVSDTCDNGQAANPDFTATSIVLAADVEVTIAGPSFATAGQAQVLNETVTVTNKGWSTAQLVTATFEIPSDLNFVGLESSTCGTCAYNAATRRVECQFGTMLVGTLCTFTVQTQVPPNTLVGTGGGTVLFTATTNSSTPNPTPNNQIATKAVTITINSNIGVTKGAPTLIEAGAATQANPEYYTIVVDNSGPSNGLGVAMYDQIPTPLTLYSATILCQDNAACSDDVTCTVNQPFLDVVLCTIGPLSVNEHVAIVVGFGVGPDVLPQVVNNTAKVSSATTDLDGDNNQSSSLTEIITSADVYVLKYGPQTTIISGDGLTYYYSFIVGNNGPSIARDVRINDTAPAPIVLQGNAIFLNGFASCARTGNFFECSFGDLAPGQSVTFTYAFTVPANAVTFGNILNCAGGNSSSTVDPNYTNNVGCNVTTVLAAPDVGVTKGGPSVIDVDSGRNITYIYNINVTNNGPSNSQNVVLTDYWTNIVPSPFVPYSVQVAGQYSCNIALNYVINCSLGTLVPGQTVPIQVFFTVDPSLVTQLNLQNGTNIINHVSVSADTPDRNTSNNDAYWPTVLVRQADLQVNKTGPASVCAGDAGGRFTVYVQNLGPADAQGISLTDPLSLVYTPGFSGITISGNQTGASCGFAGRTLTCSLGGLAYGGLITVTYPFTVVAGTPAQSANNTATASSVSADPNLANNQFTWNTSICNSAPLALSKSVSSSIVTAGDGHAHQYTLVGSNPNGPSIAQSVTITDIIPPQWTYVAGSLAASNGGSCTLSSSSFISCTWASLAPGASVIVTFSFTVDQAVPPQTVRNCGFIYSATPPNLLNNQVEACVNTTVQVSADLQLTKFGPGNACAGTTTFYLYTVTIRNNGPSRATGISLSDPLPDGVLADTVNAITVSGSEGIYSCGYFGQTLSCSLGGLSQGQTITVTFPFTVPSSTFQTTVLNTATVTSNADSNPANNNYTISTPICNQIDLSIQKWASPSAVAGSNQSYTYILTVQNLGAADAVGVTVRDPIPPQFNVVGVPVPSGLGTCNYTNTGAGVVLNCFWPRIKPVTQIETVTMSFKVPAGVDQGTYLNCAYTDNNSGQTDSNPGNNQGCNTTTVAAVADLFVTKRGPGQICAGSDDQYTVSVTNYGPAIARGVNLTDTLPIQTTPEPTTIVVLGAQGPYACAFVGQTLNCQFGDMAVNSTITILYRAQVLTSVAAVPAGVINYVAVSGSTPDGFPSTNFANWTTVICAFADLSVEKGAPALAVAGASSCVGGPCIYYLTVTNNGPADVSSVTLQDSVPTAFNVGAFVSTGTADSCSFGGASNNDLTCTWGSGLFLHGTSTTVAFYFSVPASTLPGPVQNCATVGSDSTLDNVPRNNQDCNTTLVQTQADVSIVKNGPAELCAGDPPSTFTLTVYNAGPSVARSLTIQDSLPTGLSPSFGAVTVTGAAPGASCGYGFSGQGASTLGCVGLGDLAPFQTILIVFPFSVARSVQAGPIINYASVASATFDNNTQNNIEPATVNVKSCAVLNIVKTGPSVPVVAGDLTTVSQFQITVTNSGVSDAWGVVVTDPNLFAGDVTILSIQSAIGGVCFTSVTSGNNQLVTCQYAQFAAGQSDTVTIRFQTPAGAVPGSRTNCALLASTTPNGLGGNNESCIPWTIVQQARLVTTKLGVSPIYAGQNLASQVFTVSVTNVGQSNANNAGLYDAVPSTLTVTSVNTDTGSCQFPILNNVVSCSFGTLAPGQVARVWYSYTTTAQAPLGNVVNTACASTTSVQTSTTNNCAPYTTVILCNVALAITKSVNVTSIVPGSSTIGTWTAVVTNNGFSTSKDTQLTDTWPTQLTFFGTPQSTLGACNFVAGGFFCNIGELNPGQSVTVTQQFTVDASQTATSATNQACAKSSCQLAVCDTASVIITPLVDLSVTKSDCVDSVEAGNPLPYTYTIVALNRGPANARGVTVSDTWPTALTQGALVAPGADFCSTTSVGFSCFYSVLIPGQSVTILVSYTVPANVAPGWVTNCVIVSSNSPESASTLFDNQACDTNYVLNQADLAITKTISSPDCLLAGSGNVLTYTLTVTNLGPTPAVNTVVSEVFPADLTLFSLPTRCSFVGSSKNITCRLDTLQVGQTTVLRFPFTANHAHPPGLVTNFASVWSDTPDPELCNNNATLSNLICVESDLSVTKTDGVLQVTAGDGIVYAYTFVGCNLGPSDAPTVEFADTWPLQQLPRGTINFPGANCTQTTTGFTCTLPQGLAAGACVTWTASFTVPACLEACEVCNTVTVHSSTSPDPNGSNNVATDCDQVKTEADLVVCKTDGVTQVVAGEPTVFTYTVTVCNNGPSCAQQVRLLDQFPIAVLRSGTIVIEQGTCTNVGSANDFSCNLLTLQPGQCVDVFASYTVPSTAQTCSVTNVVTVSSVTFDGVLCNNDATDVNALVEQATLAVTKTDSTARLSQHDTSTRRYTITYWNTGPSTARDVMLTDRWPAWLTQYIHGISATNGTSCVSTGGDFTCSSGDLAVGQSVTVTVPYSLVQNAPCGNFTNLVSVYSPTDSECRDASDTTIVDCVAQDILCLNCINYAVSTGICAAQYAACTNPSNCYTCLSSIRVNPRNPPAVCFSDPQSCALMQCTYNDACGLGAPASIANRPCDSPNDTAVLCPAAKRDTQPMEVTPVITQLAVSKPKAVAVPTGRMLSPKQMTVEAKLTGQVLEVKLSNLLKTEVQMQHLEMQLVDKAGASRTVDLTSAGEMVAQTSCNLAQVKLQKNWSYSCTITLVSIEQAEFNLSALKVKMRFRRVFVLELTSLVCWQVVGRGFIDTPKGYHPVVGAIKL
jgi:uncharacterized repeat protein (TIGR01451 family)